LNFTGPVATATAGALDGNATANRTVFSNVLLPGVVLLPGQEIFLRWVDLNDAGNDHGLAVDDFSLTFTSVTAVTNPPAITGEPQSRTNNAGTVATFTVTATGSALTYQWHKDSNDIFDGGNISGSSTPTLTVSNVLTADVGGYSVTVGNVLTSTNSTVATLTVIDPAINTQPASHGVIAGDTANLFVTAAGTPLLGYQWNFAGTDITDATTASLTVTNFQAVNQGAYTVVVTNGNGNSITSAPASLTLLITPSTLLTRWNFNDTNTFTTNSPTPSTGSGTADLVGGVSGTYFSGSSSDPAGPPGPNNNAWHTTAYAAQGTSNKLRGIQFNVSTVGYQNVFLTWEQRHSDTASKYARLQYSADGTTFTDGPVITMTNSGNFAFYSADLSAITSLNNNANTAFRIVQEWEATAIGNNNSNYVATAAASSYGTAGTMRFDLFTVFADAGALPPPIPLSITQSNDTVILTWTNAAFSLQAAPFVTGPYTNIPGASSPHPEPSSDATKFFRLKF
jgi:hypothetical protein